MSLRWRLLLLSLVQMICIISVSLMVLFFNAQEVIEDEVQDALDISTLMVKRSLMRDLPQLLGNTAPLATNTNQPLNLPRVLPFEAPRHVQIRLEDLNGAVLGESLRVQSRLQVPDWFIHLIAKDSMERRIALPPTLTLPRGGAVVLVSDPRIEAGEAWQNICDMLLILSLGGAVMLLLSWYGLNQILRPLSMYRQVILRLLGAGQGPSSPVSPHDLKVISALPELKRAGEQTVSLVAERDRLRADHHRLSTALQTVSDTERRNLAQKFHQALSPHTSEIRASISRLQSVAHSWPSEQGLALVEQTHSLTAHAEAIDRLIWSYMGQMVPVDLDSLPFSRALEDAFALWERQMPRIALSYRIEGCFDHLSADLTAVLYQVIAGVVARLTDLASSGDVNVLLHNRSSFRTTPSQDDHSLHIQISGRLGLKGLACQTLQHSLGSLHEQVMGLGGSILFRSPCVDSDFTLEVFLPLYRPPSLTLVETQGEGLPKA